MAVSANRLELLQIADAVAREKSISRDIVLSSMEDALQKAARAHNIEFSIHRVARAEDIAAAIDSAQASGATAVNIVASPLFYANRRLIMDRLAAAHLPTIYEWPETAEEGGLAAYGPRLRQLFSEIMPRQIVQVPKQRN